VTFEYSYNSKVKNKTTDNVLWAEVMNYLI
jgi:hypothetical protein